MTGKCARLVTAGSWLGAAGIKLHTGLGQSQLDRGSDTAEMRLQWNFYVTVSRSLDSVAHFSSCSFLQCNCNPQFC